MNVARIGGTMLAVVVGLALAAYGVLARKVHKAESQRTEGATTRAAIGPKQRTAAGPGNERWLAVVVARDAVDLASQVEGTLKEVKVNVGDKVKPGAIVAEIDDAPLRRELALAQASVDQARAGESKAVAELDQARERALRRKQAESGLSAEEISTAKYQETTGAAALKGAQAQVAEAKARVAQLAEKLKHTEIRAPFEGTIAQRYKAPGTAVGPQVPIVRLIQSADMCVRFAVPVEDAAALKVGEHVKIDVDVLHEALPGRIENVAPEVDPGSQMLYVEASLSVGAEWKSRLQSGLVARVSRAVAELGERAAAPR